MIPEDGEKRKKTPNVDETSEILTLKLEWANCIVSFFFERENTVNGS